YVEDQQIGAALPLVPELLRGDLHPVVRRLGADAAERLVVDQLRHGRMRAADRAIRILLQLELPKLQLQGVEQDQASEGGLTRSQDELDRPHRLDRADDAREDAEHAAFGTRGNQSGRWRLRVETAVARPALGVEYRRLTLEAKNRAVDVRLVEQHACIVHEVAGREVIGAV